MDHFYFLFLMRREIEVQLIDHEKLLGTSRETAGCNTQQWEVPKVTASTAGAGWVSWAGEGDPSERRPRQRGAGLGRPRTPRGLYWSYSARLTVSRWWCHKHQIWGQMSWKWNQWGKVMRGALFHREETRVEKRMDEGRWGRKKCLSSQALHLITSLSYLLIKL